MLLNLKEMLQTAADQHFAVGAFNCSELSLVRAVVEEAEAAQAPAIIQAAAVSYTHLRFV